MDNIWFTSALWIGLALITASLQARVAVSVALLEIIIGAAAGNLVDITRTCCPAADGAGARRLWTWLASRGLARPLGLLALG